VVAFGRARAWFPGRARVGGADADPSPCGLATWPVVGFDGTVVACGNDDVIAGPTPAHLRLGHAAHDGWPTIRERCLRSSIVRAIRVFGPEYLADRHGETRGACSGYCQTCMKLSSAPAVLEGTDALMEQPSAIVLEEQVSALQLQAGAVSFAGRHGIPRYAELVRCGATS
jgi:hypothetical protein